MSRPHSIGIDLGTTNSCVATIDDAGRPRVIESRQGQRTLPSSVALLDDNGEDRILVGEPARRQAVSHPRETLFAVKRLMGKAYDDPEVAVLRKALPYQVVRAPNGDAWIKVGERVLSPQEVSARVLQMMRGVAEDHFGDGAKVEAIITVPAYFDDTQRQATKDAAEIAGLTVRRLLNEPTAAALGYGAHREPAARFAVCDLGGGTFDVSIVNVEEGVFEVISTHGDNMLGGDDFDRVIFEALAAEIKESHGLDVGEDPTAMQRVRDEAQNAKHVLSEAAQVTLQLPHLGIVRGKPLTYVRTIKRIEVEKWTAHIVNRLVDPCREAVANAGLEPRDIDQVLLVGGMTRMPAVQRKLEAIFGRPPAKSAHPDEVVAIGAATQCAILDGKLEDVVLLDVTSRSVGIHAGDGRFLPIIPRNATIPTRESRIVTTSRDGQRELAVEIYEGEFTDIQQNRLLGTIRIDGLPDAGAGEVLVLVEMTVDVDGLLRVSARDLVTGEAQVVKRLAATGLLRRDVRRMAASLALA